MDTAGVSPAPRSTAARATAPRVAAWIGIGLSLLLLPVALLGQATVTDQVDATADAVVTRLDQAIPLVESASTAVDAAVTAARTVASTAESVASHGGSLQSALDEVERFSGAYASARGSYEGAVDAANAALERLAVIAPLLPGDTGQSLRDAMAALDRRIQQLEASVGQLIDAPVGGLVAQLAATIAERARQVQSALEAVAGTLDRAAAQLQQTRDAVSVRGGEITLAVTILAALISSWLVYTAVLNWVLLRAFRRATDQATGRSAT